MQKLPEEVTQIFNKVADAGYAIYLVGGSVRDLLLGRAVQDWDFTTSAKPEQILELFPEGFYDNQFGTVGIPIKGLDPEQTTVFEITTMRKEGNYKDFRHPVEVSWTEEIEEDLARRDFTINAIAMDPDGKMIDPFSGEKDLENGLIKAVNDPNKRFQEDALRMMRAIRLNSQLNFEIETQTFDAIKSNAPFIKNIAFERVIMELFKILQTEHAYEGVLRLREANLLEKILPELEACFGIVQEGPKHARVYDIGEHSLLTLKFTPSNDPLVRLAALLHDIGKADTFQKDSTGNVTFYNHEIVGARKILEVSKRFNLSKKQSDKLYRLIRWHMFTVSENQTDSAIRRFIRNVGLENLDDIFALRVGDRLGGGTATATSWRMEKMKQRIKEVMTKPFSITDLKINGRDVMEGLKIKPSRKVGEILDQLFQEVLEDSEKNERDYLLKRIKEIG